MDDLISRKAAIEAIVSQSIYETREAITEAMLNDYKKSDEWLGGIDDAISTIEEMNAIPAVPLDKLCGWLERYASMKCYGCIEAFRSCEDEENQEVSVCNSRERWKAMLTKWMEGQHET